MHIDIEGSAEAGYVDEMVPEVAQKLAWGALVSREAVEDEIDTMLSTTRTFWRREPDEVLLLISAMSARCTELAVHLHRLEGVRTWKQVRTQQVERLLAEFERQWKLHSRMVEIRRQDLESLR